MSQSAIASVSNYLREELPRVIHESLPQVAPFFKDIVATSVGVSSDSSAIGRLWQVTHLYSAGIAGLIKYANVNGPDFLTPGNLGKTTHLLDFTADRAIYPTAMEAPHAGSLKRVLTLHMTVGNFSVPVSWMQADALSAAQIKQVARDIKAVGDLRAMVEATGFHSLGITNASGYETKILGSVNAATEEGTSNVVKITLLEKYGTIHNFRAGMAIDIVKGDGTDGGVLQDGVATDATDRVNYDASGNYVHVIIQSVDYINRAFYCVGVGNNDGAIEAYDTTHGWKAGGSAPIAQYDYIVLRDCSTYTAATRPMPTWGIEDWVKASGYIMGGASGTQVLDLDTYHQFRSVVQAITGPLTDDVMNKWVGNYLDAYPGLSLDTIITTNGVTQKYLQQFGLYNNRNFYDRQGKSIDAKGGWAEIGYEFNGRTLRWIVDPLCAKGRLYAMKFAGGNIKRYMPPSISSGNEKLNGSSAGTDGEVQFLAPLGGHTGVFMIARNSSGAATDILEAPFHQYNLVAPIDPRGIKLTGLTEVAAT